MSDLYQYRGQYKEMNEYANTKENRKNFVVVEVSSTRLYRNEPNVGGESQQRL